MARILPLALLLVGCGSLGTLPTDLGTTDDDDTDSDVVTDSDTGDTDDGGSASGGSGSGGNNSGGSGGGDTDDGTPTTGTQPILTEVVSTQNLRYIEIYNPTTSAVSLSGWKLNMVPEGQAASLESISLPNQTLQTGGILVLCHPDTAAAFQSRFGRACTATSDVVAGDGDDAYILKNGAAIVDIYGELGVDGTGTAWEYTGSTATRKAGRNAARTGWTAADWEITSGAGDASAFDRN